MALNRNPPPAARPSSLFRKPLGFIRLYLDDLDAVLRYLDSRVDGGVQIAAGRSTADTVEDLTSATRRELDTLRLESRSPQVIVELGPNSSAVLTWEDSVKAKAVVTDLSRLLRDEHRSTAAAIVRMSDIAPLMPVGVLGVLAVALPAFQDPAPWNQILTSILLVALLVGVVALSARLTFLRWRRGGVVLHRRQRGDSGKRTSAAAFAVVSIISAAAGGAATALVTWWLGM